MSKLLKGGAIDWVARDGGTMTPENQVLAVVDYDQFQNAARTLLGDLQAIKANREGSSSGHCSASTLRYRRSTSLGHRQSSTVANSWRSMRAMWNSLRARDSGRQVRNARRQYPGKHRTVLEALRVPKHCVK